VFVSKALDHKNTLTRHVTVVKNSFAIACPKNPILNRIKNKNPRHGVKNPDKDRFSGPPYLSRRSYESSEIRRRAYFPLVCVCWPRHLVTGVLFQPWNWGSFWPGVLENADKETGSDRIYGIDKILCCELLSLSVKWQRNGYRCRNRKPPTSIGKPDNDNDYEYDYEYDHDYDNDYEYDSESTCEIMALYKRNGC